jgi:aspartate/tyrosine/aromatic aminotransferase
MERLSLVASQLNINLTGTVSEDVFSHLKLAPPDPILGTALAYKADKSDIKMNLGVGAYRDDNEKPYVFNVVRKVEKELLSGNLNKELKVMLNSINTPKNSYLARTAQRLSPHKLFPELAP